MKTVVMVLTGATTWTMKMVSAPDWLLGPRVHYSSQEVSQGNVTVQIATPGGVPPTVDPLSLAVQYNNNDADAVASQQEYL